MQCVSFQSSAIECPVLPVVHHLDLSTRSRDAGTVLEVQCHPGYQFPDGTRSRTLICVMHGEWNTVLEDCASECMAIDVSGMVACWLMRSLTVIS